MSSEKLFTQDEFVAIDESPLEEAVALAAQLLYSANTALGGAPESEEDKRKSLDSFLREVTDKIASVAEAIPPPLINPGPTSTFIDLLAGHWASQLGLTTPALLTAFAIVAARYGIPGLLDSYRQ